MSRSSTDDRLRDGRADSRRGDARSADGRERSRSGRAGSARAGSGVRARVRRALGRVFSPKAFLVALALAVGGLLVAGSVLPPFVPLGGLLGVLAAGFVLGAAGRRRYLEVAAAGGIAAALALVFDYVVFSLLGAGVPLAAAGAGAGALAGVAGHYLGRDLRDGATRQL